MGSLEYDTASRPQVLKHIWVLWFGTAAEQPAVLPVLGVFPKDKKKNYLI